MLLIQTRARHLGNEIRIQRNPNNSVTVCIGRAPAADSIHQDDLYDIETFEFAPKEELLWECVQEMGMAFFGKHRRENTKSRFYTPNCSNSDLRDFRDLIQKHFNG